VFLVDASYNDHYSDHLTTSIIIATTDNSNIHIALCGVELG